MLTLSVPDMSCGHCVKAITEAVQEIDTAATVSTDLDARTVRIETLADSVKILKSLDDAGYPATLR